MAVEKLSPETRKVRKSLMAVCLIGFALAKVQLTFEKFTILGSVFIVQNYQAIPLIIGLIILYYLVTFLFYALDEYQQEFLESRKEYLKTIGEGETPLTLYEAEERYLKLDRRIKRFEDRGQFDNNDILSKEKFEIAKEKYTRRKKELGKLKKIISYLETQRFTIWNLRHLKVFRTFVEIILPVLISIYILLLIFVFTDFSVLNPNKVNKEEGIKQEQPIQEDKSAIDLSIIKAPVEKPEQSKKE